MRRGWQASATYALSWLWDAENQPFSRLNIVPFKVASDLGNDFTYGQDDQRHRLVFSGIWEITHGLQLSGIYYLGAGIRSSTNYRAHLRNVGVGRATPFPPHRTIAARDSILQAD